MEQPMDEVTKRLLRELNLTELMRTRFWGSVEISFQDGEPTTIRKTETKKLYGSNPHAKQQS
jgi:hypothetical protein